MILQCKQRADRCGELFGRFGFLLMAEDESLAMNWDTWVGSYETPLRVSMWH